MNEEEIASAVQLLVRSRTSTSVEDTVDTERLDYAPENLEDVYRIQAAVAQQTGPVGGWKTSAETADSVPIAAPVFKADIHQSGATLPADRFRLLAVEAELAYRMADDLPARETPYSEDEFLAAVDTMLPLIELVDSRLSDFGAAGDLWKLADNQINAAFVLGEPIADWQDLDTSGQDVSVYVDDTLLVARTGWQFPGTPARLATRFANAFSRHCGGITAGQIITTGSMTGIDFIDTTAQMRAVFRGLPPVEVSTR